jgi:hypothetical protein
MNGVLFALRFDGFLFVLLLFLVVIPLIGFVASRLRESGQPSNPVPPDRGSGRIQEQIDEFLRRAAARRGVPQQQSVEQAQILPDDADDDAPVGGRFAKASQKYMDTSDFARRSEQFGGEVVQADRQFTQNVQQAFSGEVGRLASRPGETAQPVEVVEDAEEAREDLSRPSVDALPEAGSGLGEFLGTPENIAHAVIMSEVLRRPEW